MSEQRHGGTASGNGDPLSNAGRELGSKAAEVSGKAAGIADKATGAVQDAADLATAASGLASTAIEQGKTLISSARGQATGFADARKDDAAQTVEDLANSLRGTGEQFDGRPNIQAFVGSAADGLDQLASTIRDRSFAELYGEFEGYARARPVMVGAAAVATGFLLARFIKSSAENMSEASRDVVLRRTTVRKPVRGEA